jgi:hypothetical protein
VETQASLFGLMEFRARRPRAISLTDEDLDSIGLASLTQRTYLAQQSALLSQLSRINEVYIEIYSRQLVPKCQSLSMFYLPPVVPSEDLSLEALYNQYLTASHHYAAGRLSMRLRSSLGDAVRR